MGVRGLLLQGCNQEGGPGAETGENVGWTQTFERFAGENLKKLERKRGKWPRDG
jgi:hypothetical protein